MREVIERVAPGVHRVSVPHPHRLSTNVYVIAGDPVALVDAGHFAPFSVDVLTGALSHLGFAPEQIGYVFLTDGAPGRVGALLAQRFPAARIAAHAALARRMGDYAAYSLDYRRAVVTPVCEDLRLFRGLDLDSLEAAVRAALQVGGGFSIDLPVTADAYVDVGERRFYAVAAPGPTATHMAWALAPDGLVFSGELGQSGGLALPAMLAGLGGGVSLLAGSAARLTAYPGRLLPAHGPVVDPAAPALARVTRLTVQQRAMLRGIVTGGPRSLATLYMGVTGGRRFSPLQTAEEAATLRVFLDDMVAAGELVCLQDGAGRAYALGPAALAPRRLAA